MEETLQLLRKGDNKAFETLYNEFFKSSYVFVSRYITYDEEVIDIVQETFFNIWKKRGMFSDISYFKAYLYKSLRNNALKYIRNKEIKRKHINRIKQESSSEDFLQAIFEEEVHRDLIGLLNKLPETRRKIMVLTISGLTNDQIAEDMGISVNTVKTQKKRAYFFLREHIKDTCILFFLAALDE